MITAPLTKQASANSSSSSEETLEIAIATQQKSTRIEIPQESNKRPKQEYPSMEDNALSTLPAQQRRLFPRARSVSLMTPTLSLEEQRQDNSSYYQSKVPMPVVTFTSDSSFQEWSPLPFFEPVLNSSMPRPHPPYLSSNVYRNPATPFCDMSFLQASASLTFNNGSSPGPPPLMSSVSSKGFLLAQPMIQTPAPTAPKTFFSANGYPRSIVHRQMTNMTPMSENSFHPAIVFSPLTEKSVDPAMFSIDSTISGGTPYSPLRKDSVNPVLSVAAQLCEPIAVERSITTPPNAAKIKEPVTVRNGHRGTTKPASTRSTQLVQEKTPRAKSFPRLVEAAKMHARVASKRAAQEDEGDEHAEELFCTCPKSKCLKLYCVCFQRGIFCDTSACRCRTCKNTMKHDGPKGARTMAILAIEKRRDDAFGKRAKQTGLGCSCKTNKCLKKYCACYAEGNSCADKCGCVDCHNKAGPVAWFDGTPLYMEREMGSGIYPV